LSWLVAYCRSRCELFAQERLAELGLPTFLPYELIRRKRRVRGNLHKVEWRPEPLFPRYLFTFGPLRTILDARGVLGVVSNIASGPLLLADAVVDALRALAGPNGEMRSTDLSSNTAALRDVLGAPPVVGQKFVFSEKSVFAGFVGCISNLAPLDASGSLRAFVNILGADTEVSLPQRDVGRLYAA